MDKPTPKQVKKSRMDAGLTQTEASLLVYSKLRTWQHWENGDRAMPAAIYELFIIKALKILP